MDSEWARSVDCGEQFILPLYFVKVAEQTRGLWVLTIADCMAQSAQ